MRRYNSFETFAFELHDNALNPYYWRGKLNGCNSIIEEQREECSKQLEELEQLELPLWEDEDIESEDYIETIKKNGKIKMEEE